MRSPILAMLWENWRLTRREAAQRLSLGIVAGSAGLAVSPAAATIAFVILLSQYAMFWMSIAKLNGGRFWDGYKPGFPFHLLYTRPVPTGVFVGVAMAYDAVSCAALYLVSAALLGFAFGRPLPLLSVIVWLVTFHLVSTCVQWATRSRVVQYLGSFFVCLPFAVLLWSRADLSPLRVEFSIAENALMASIGLLSIGLTVAGVSRQRHGDERAALSRKARSAGPEWFVNLLRSCPTSSATRAQVWFEFRSSGLGVLLIASAIAVLIPLMFAVSVPVDAIRVYAVSAMIFALPAVLLLLGGNAFGIRWKQGRIFAGVFETTQPASAARLAGVKILVRTVCLLAASIVVGMSLWASASLAPAWMGDGRESAMEASFWELPNSRRAELVGPEAHAVWMWRHSVQEAFRGLTGYQLAGFAVVVTIGIAVLVALRAALAALQARYRRRVTIAVQLLLLYGLALVLLGIAGRRGYGPAAVIDAVLQGPPWLAAAAMAIATGYLVWSVLAERLLTLRQACVAVLVSAAFGAAWLTVLRTAGVSISAMAATDLIGMLLPALLPLMASVLAPWALSRIRHT